MSVTFLRSVSPSGQTPDSVARLLPKIGFDITDLFYYYADGHTPTGIQRVQQELCLNLSADSRYQGIELVVYDRAIQRWRQVPLEWLQSILELSRSFGPSAGSWNEVYQKFAAQLARFPQKRFEPQEWLVNVGASLSLPSYFAQVRQLRGRGVRIGIFLHDCIPVRHPAYFDYFHTVEHSHWLAQVRECADLVICNSDATRDDYVSLVHPPVDQKIKVCRLNAAWDESDLSPEADAYLTELLSDIGLQEEEFVLCVGTIEPRKNHLSLIHVWDRLRQTHPGNCPKLLCVGRIGWKSEAVLAQAKALGQLDNKIHFFNNLSDELLRGLYRKCLFSVYISYYEGWGLPVSESLAAGKVCVAGRNSSLLEAGAGFAIHVDERSETSIHEAISRLIDSPAALTQANERIRTEYRSRSWGDVLSDITDFVTEAAHDEGLRPALPVLEMNVLYQFGRPEPIQDFESPKVGEVFCIGNGWHQPESWGVWTNKQTSELAFLVKSGHRGCTLFLALTSPPVGGAVKVYLNGQLALSVNRFVGKKVVRISLDSVTPDSADAPGFTPVALRLISDRVQSMRDIHGSGDERTLGLGYVYLVGFERTSVFERLEFLEKVITGMI